MFDVIIGHPPSYEAITKFNQIKNSHTVSVAPLYHLFVDQSKKLNPKYISLILPARWISGETRGLSSFKESMFQDGKLKKLYDYENAQSLFPTFNTGGGVCFFLWDRDYQGECSITFVSSSGEISEQKRQLNPESTYIRDLSCLNIIEKVRKVTPENTFMNTMISSRQPFGLESFIRPHQKGELTLRYNGGSGPFPRELITKNQEWINKWKVMVTKLVSVRSKFKRVLQTVEILPPNHICTETYLIAGIFDTKQEAENLISYLKTKFARFFISRLSFTQNLCKDKFQLVPIQDFSKPWTDEELYKKYQLTNEEIQIIETQIRVY